MYLQLVAIKLPVYQLHSAVHEGHRMAQGADRRRLSSAKLWAGSTNGMALLDGFDLRQPWRLVA